MCSVICMDVQAHIYTNSYMYVAGSERAWGRANSVVRRAALTRFQQRQHDQKNKKKKEFANGLNDSTSRPETCPLCALTHVS